MIQYTLNMQLKDNKCAFFMLDKEELFRVMSWIVPDNPGAPAWPGGPAGPGGPGTPTVDNPARK